MCEYTPGIAALSTAAGRGASQRSGFHSSASSPQSVLERLHAMIAMTMFVPRGMAICLIVDPSVPRIGWEMGNTASCMVLEMRIAMSLSVRRRKTMAKAHPRNVWGAGGYLGLWSACGAHDR